MIVYPGSVIRVKGEFYDAATRNPSDAPGLMLTVLRPDGSEYEGAEIVHDSVGKYHADISVNQSGKWSYRWQAAQAGDEGEFIVEASAFV